MILPFPSHILVIPAVSNKYSAGLSNYVQAQAWFFILFNVSFSPSLAPAEPRSTRCSPARMQEYWLPRQLVNNKPLRWGRMAVVREHHTAHVRNTDKLAVNLFFSCCLPCWCGCSQSHRRARCSCKAFASLLLPLENCSFVHMNNVGIWLPTRPGLISSPRVFVRLSSAMREGEQR